MFPEFSTAIGDLRNDGNLVTIHENDPGVASFAVHHFVSGELKKKDGRVLLVGLEQSFGHYHSVGMKLGNNLVRLQQQGRLVFYEGLKKLLAASVTADDDDASFDFVVKDDDRRCSINDDLKPLYLDLKRLVADHRPAVVVLDNVSVLLHLGASVTDVHHFLLRLLRLVATAAGDKTAADLVVKVESGDEDDGGTRLSNLLYHASSVNVSVSSLRTGRSRDVSGCFRVEERERGGDFSCRDFQFWVEDRNVRVFAPGTSAAVL